MPEITIQQATFERLQRFARPLVDTSDSVILMALDALEQARSRNGSEYRGRSERVVDPKMPDDVTHTRVLEARIDGKLIQNPKWNRLLDEMLRIGMMRVGNVQQLRTISSVNLCDYQKEDKGYSYLRDVGISIQGQDAKSACRAIISLAEVLGIAIEVRFEWRRKEGAAFPGMIGRLNVASPHQSPEEIASKVLAGMPVRS